MSLTRKWPDNPNETGVNQLINFQGYYFFVLCARVKATVVSTAKWQRLTAVNCKPMKKKIHKRKDGSQ